MAARSVVGPPPIVSSVRASHMTEPATLDQETLKGALSVVCCAGLAGERPRFAAVALCLARRPRPLAWYPPGAVSSRHPWLRAARMSRSPCPRQLEPTNRAFALSQSSLCGAARWASRSST